MTSKLGAVAPVKCRLMSVCAPIFRPLNSPLALSARAVVLKPANTPGVFAYWALRVPLPHVPEAATVKAFPNGMETVTSPLAVKVKDRESMVLRG